SGGGAVGAVNGACEGRSGGAVAIKVLLGGRASSPEVRPLFEREAKVLAALSHPNLVAIFDVGAEQGICFAVMEFLAGETLLDLLARGALPFNRVIEFGTAVADGLAAAHAQGIVHRDLKPANVFLTSSGLVKILDFGLARQTNPHSQEATVDYVTEVGQIMGTVGYMAPEQASGNIPDSRSDIFSLGCVLFEMATGRK